MRELLVAAALLVASPTIFPAPVLAAPASIGGLWDAVVVTTDAEVPFRFEIAVNGSEAQVFFEGDRKVGSSSGTFVDGALALDYDHLNDPRSGSKAINGRHLPEQASEFEAAADSDAPVQTDRSRCDGRAPLSGSWECAGRRGGFGAARHADLACSCAVCAEVSGSILRVDGDTGTLVGHWQNNKLVLSHFAGERPNLFEASLNADGTLAVTLNSTAHYLVVRSGEARAKGIPEPPDPSRYTSVKDPTTPFQFAFPDLTGKIVSNTDPKFSGKVVILSIGGSWCPNCHDEAPFLNEVYRDFRARGLEVMGLMFENDPDPNVSRPRVQSFIKRYGVEYPMLIAGTMQPSPTSKTINEALPQLVNFGAYPTTIFLGRDGRVRSLHAGFASPATGAEHTRLKQELRTLVEKLLAEPAQGSAADRPVR